MEENTPSEITEAQNTKTTSHIHTSKNAFISSVITKSLVYPLDTLKTRKQQLYLNCNLSQFKIASVAHHGLFRGLGYKILLYAPYQSLYMTTYLHANKKFTEHNISPGLIVTYSAISAELGASIIRLPMEVSKTFAQQLLPPIEQQVKSSLKKSRLFSPPGLGNFINSTPYTREFVKFVLNNLLTGKVFFYQTICHDIPFSIIHWNIYEYLKNRLIFPDYTNLPVFLSGATAGAIAALCVNPADVLKTRLIEQLYTSRGQTANVLILDFRIRHLFRGVGLKMAHISASSGIYLLIFEWLQRRIRVD